VQLDKENESVSSLQQEKIGEGTGEYVGRLGIGNVVGEERPSGNYSLMD